MTIKEKLQELDENELREKIVIPLMKALGATNVRSWHGKSEKGIDILYKKENDFNELLYKGILLKARKIAKALFNSSVRKEFEEAIARSFADPEYPENKIKIYGLAVMTSHGITQDVRDLIQDLSRRFFPNVEIIDGDRLCGFIERIINEYNGKQNSEQKSAYYNFKVEDFSDFCTAYLSNIYPKKIIYDGFSKEKAVNIPEGKPFEDRE